MKLYEVCGEMCGVFWVIIIIWEGVVGYGGGGFISVCLIGVGIFVF